MISRSCILVLGALVGLGGIGCARVAPPELLTLHEVGPGLLEAGSEIAVTGEGFPEGRIGILELDGTLAAPGRGAEEVRLELAVQTVSSGRATKVLDGADLNQLTRGARHGTFRGRARIEFEPVVAMSPALSGSRADVVLDLFAPKDPSVAGLELEAAQKELAARFASHVGLGLSERFVVKDVLAGSEAELLGLATGDRLLELDGVHLLASTDFVPAVRGLVSTIEYETADGVRASARLARGGFRSSDPSLTLRAVLGAALVALTVLFVARPPRSLVWALCQVRSPTEVRRGRRRRSFGFRYWVMALVAVGFWLSYRAPVTLGFELGLALALTIFCHLVAAFALGGRRQDASAEGALLGLRFTETFAALVGILPLLVGVVFRATEAGTLRLAEFALGNGNVGTPALFSSPWAFLLGALALVCLLPSAGLRPLLDEDLVVRAPVVRAVENVGEALALLVWCELFLGSALSSPADSALHGALLLVSTLVVSLVLDALRRRLGYPRRSEVFGIFVLPSAATSAALAAVVLGLEVSGELPRRAELFGFLGAVLAPALAVMLFVAQRRSLGHRGRTVDPWL